MRTSISPQLFVRGGREAIDFYVLAFDAREVYRVGGSAELTEVVAELVIGDSSFWVSDEAIEYENFSPETLGGGSFRILLRVEEPRTVFARALSHGALQLAPVVESHGWLMGRLLDPFGHRWEIGKPLHKWPPASGGPEGQ